MGEVVNIKQGKRSNNKKSKRRSLEAIKKELLRDHGIDLDELLLVEEDEASINFSYEEFEELSTRILEVIDEFCSLHPHIELSDILFTLDNVEEFLIENSDI